MNNYKFMVFGFGDKTVDISLQPGNIPPVVLMFHSMIRTAKSHSGLMMKSTRVIAALRGHVQMVARSMRILMISMVDTV